MLANFRNSTGASKSQGDSLTSQSVALGNITVYLCFHVGLFSPDFMYINPSIIGQRTQNRLAAYTVSLIYSPLSGSSHFHFFFQLGHSFCWQFQIFSFGSMCPPHRVPVCPLEACTNVWLNYLTTPTIWPQKSSLTL